MLAVGLAGLASSAAKGQAVSYLDAGGHRLEVMMTPGPGPTVVFDGGAVSGIGSWPGIADSVAARAATVRYSRAGFGGSEIGPAPRTSHRAATELHSALETGGVQFPVVLVSYSLGSLVAMSFVDLYPADVAGLVFIDPATNLTYQRQLNERPEWLPGLVEEVTASIEHTPPGWRGQMEALPESLGMLSEFGPVTGVPAVVLTAMTGRGEWPKATAQDMEEWYSDHQSLVDRISGARHTVLPDATHGSILRDPIVMREILSVLDAVRR